MIIEYLRYTINERRQSNFIADYKNAAIPLQKSPYCEGYEFCQCIEDPSKFIIRIQWTSSKDHMQGFRGSEEFKAFFPQIKAYLDVIDEMRHYESIE